jgi:hypothetical protein
LDRVVLVQYTRYCQYIQSCLIPLSV